MKKLFLLVLCFSFACVAMACNTTTPTDKPGEGGCDDPIDTRPWYEKDGNFTFNDYIGGTTSMNWNPLSWETNDDSYVLGYLSMGFSDYKVNAEKDNWEVVWEMAEEQPKDVTASYVGQYGIKAGEINKAFMIKLNKKATWQDGTAITADDYIYSMQQQLDPDQLNRRADSYYGGDFSIVNAQNYLYNGKFAYGSAMVSAAMGADEYVDPATFKVDEATGQYYIEVEGVKKYCALNLNDGGNWGESIKTYAAAGYLPGDEAVIAALEAEAGKGVYGLEGWVPMTETTLPLLQLLIAHLHGAATVEDYANAAGAYAYQEWEEMAYYGMQNPVLDFSEVGLFKVDDYTIVLVIERELANPTFYLPYYLSSTWLVNKSLYESSWKTNPDGTKVQTYMTTKDTSISYGPYMLDGFEADKQITFVRNPKWYGYTDGKHEGQFQTDKISCQVIAEHTTALNTFLLGEIDGIALQSADMEKYGGSKYIQYTPQSYTTKFTFNTDYTSLAARSTDTVNKTMLTNVDFRKAVSLAIDRSYFTSAFTSAAAPGYGLINYMYMLFDDEGGEVAYRNMDDAKKALVELYGLTYGEGGEYESLNEAYKAITGFDMDAAKAAMAKAYEDGKAANLYKDGQTIEIELSVYSSDAIYQSMFEYVRDQVAKAAVGTPLEGKVVVKMRVDEDYYNSLYAGKADMIFSTWGGATYGTLSLLHNVYCDDYTGNGNQMELGFNTNAVPVKCEVKGTEYTHSLKEWADWLSGMPLEGLQTYTAYSYEEQVAVLAKLEKAYLESYCAIPLYYRQSASLYSQKINYVTSTYINLVGFGGIREITYNYTDEKWADYCKGGLNY